MPVWWGGSRILGGDIIVWVDGDCEGAKMEVSFNSSGSYEYAELKLDHRDIFPEHWGSGRLVARAW